ncbi:hypothetical protein [Paraglaciecola arctica]|uniref:hypothetical protein n=1 Tax=Paraglaciecola arctica TaxID=1128911 RepID=UPI001C073F55|nr:hypothetical protein [Paraglaciecola arctica]MBU3005066.1 hypothetical protein [Paraglaciecola arctica]
MDKNQAADERNRSLFINITVVVVFISLMLGFMIHLNNGSTNLRRLALENLAEQFSTSVSNAHWQWQGEGRPEIVLLITYANKLGENETLIETDRKPIFMSHLGWPKAEPTSEGCANIWKMLLNMPMNIDGFKIFAEYYDGIKLNDNPLDSVCRYRLSTGPYFEYKVFSGQVLKVKE